MNPLRIVPFRGPGETGNRFRDSGETAKVYPGAWECERMALFRTWRGGAAFPRISFGDVGGTRGGTSTGWYDAGKGSGSGAGVRVGCGSCRMAIVTRASTARAGPFVRSARPGAHTHTARRVIP